MPNLAGQNLEDQGLYIVTGRIVLDGGTGSVATVHLVSIGFTGCVHTEATATAFAMALDSISNR